MRSASDQRRISGNSWDEVWGPFQRAVSDLRVTHDFGGDKLRPGHVVNALVLRFLRLGDAERASEMTRWLAELELLVAEDDREREAARAKLPPGGHPPDKVVRTREVKGPQTAAPGKAKGK